MILHIVGARPNFMKAAPVIRAIREKAKDSRQILVHTGQHYDKNMSGVFFKSLNLPEPQYHLGIGGLKDSEHVSKTMELLAPILELHKPEIVVVYGDVNSTLAGCMAAFNAGIPSAHVESGLRSFDRTMPEEVNRIWTDRIADILFTPTANAIENLKKEPIQTDQIHFVGNVMIDSLVYAKDEALERWNELRQRFPWEKYMLVTLHRPSNVDDTQRLLSIMQALKKISVRIPLVFPMHPRTVKALGPEVVKEFDNDQFRIIEPLDYIDFLSLEMHAGVVLTDSGGVQEETTYLNVPCLTLRPNTERPITVSEGTNQLLDCNPKNIEGAVNAILDQALKPALKPIEKWDGHAANRIADILLKFQ